MGQPITPASRRPRLGALLRAAPALALLAGGLAACAPQATNSTYSAAGIGRSQYVEYGTIIGMRPVTVQGSGGGVGTLAGAAAGGVAGSFIGGDPRSNILGALGGAIIGGVAGNVAERSMTTGQAIEFTIRTPQGDMAVVQSNEEALQVGEHVRILRGDRTRITRDANPPPPPPPGYQPQPYQTQPYQTPGSYTPPKF